VNIKIEDINDTRKKLLVTVAADEVEQEHDELVKEFAKVAKVPGFRPGKAPLPMVAKRFAKDITEELNKKIFTRAYREGLEESKIKPMKLIDGPTESVKRGEENAIAFVLDVHPEFSLPEYMGLPVQALSEAVSEEEVDKAVENLRQQRADFSVVERESKAGDYVKLSYEGKVDGQPIAELVTDRPIFGTQSNTWEEVGAEASAIPGFAAALEGLKAGDKKEIAVTFPEDFVQEALRGKSATYAVELSEVRERVLPELTEDFLQSLGISTVEEIKERIREDLERQKKQENYTQKRQQVAEQLLNAIEFPLPESAVERETQVLLRQFMENNLQRGAKPEDFESNKEELHANARKAAHDRAKSQLILARVAEAEKIAVDDQDLSRYVYFESQRRRQKPDQFVKELRKNPEEVDAIRAGLLLDKTLDFLVEKASISGAES
jgi:trigger factor